MGGQFSGKYVLQPAGIFCYAKIELNAQNLMCALAGATETGFLQFNYLQMYRTVRSSRQRVARTLGEQQAQRALREETRASLMMLSATVAFIVCFSPLLFVFVAGLFGFRNTPALDATISFVPPLTALVTPLLYGIFSPKIRWAVRALVCCTRENANGAGDDMTLESPRQLPAVEKPTNLPRIEANRSSAPRSPMPGAASRFSDAYRVQSTPISEAHVLMLPGEAEAT